MLSGEGAEGEGEPAAGTRTGEEGGDPLSDEELPLFLRELM